MKFDKVLEEVGLNPDDFEKNSRGEYTYRISGAGEFGKLYSLFDDSEELEEAMENNALTTDRSVIKFNSVNDDYSISLQADFDADTYDIVIKED